MRAKKTEQLLCYPFYDTDGLTRHLEKRASQGWVLDGRGALGWHFRREEPQTLRYTVLYDPKAAGYDPEPTEEQRTLAEFCAHAGWQLLFTDGVTQIYVSDREDATPIHTDPMIALQNLCQFGEKCWLLPCFFLVLGTLSFVLSLHTWRTKLIEELLDPTGWSILPATLVMVLASLVYLLPWLRYRRQAARAAEQGAFIPTPGHPHLLLALALLFILLLMLQFASASGTGQLRSMLLRTVLLLVPNAAVFGTRAYLKHRKVDADTNRATSLAACFNVALLTLPLLLAVNASSNGTPLPELSDVPAITVEQLLGPVEGREAQTGLYLRGSSSILTETCGDDYSYTEVMTEDPNQPQLSYSQLDVHWAPVYRACLRQTLHIYDWAKEDHPGIAFDAHPAPEGTDAYYVLNQPIHNSFVVILCWEGRMVTLSTSWSLTEDQLTQVAAALQP